MYECDTNPTYCYSHDLLCRKNFMRENEIDFFLYILQSGVSWETWLHCECELMFSRFQPFQEGQFNLLIGKKLLKPFNPQEKGENDIKKMSFS